MPRLARFTGPLLDLDTFVVFDDFIQDQADTVFKDTVTDTGTVLMGDAAGGIAALTPSDGTVADNDEVYLASPNEVFKLASEKPIYGKCRLQFTETTAGVYNAAFGFQNAVGANSIIDDGAGLKVSGDCVAIYKVDGGTVWKAVSVSNGGTATVSTSTTTAGGASYQVLEIFIEHYTTLLAEVTFKVDGVYLKDSNGIVIRHTVAYASSTEMSVWAGAKLGAATNNDVLNLDYIYAHQLR